jgi:hypothetical protein
MKYIVKNYSDRILFARLCSCNIVESGVLENHNPNPKIIILNNKLTLREHLSSPSSVLVGSVLLLFCVVLLYVSLRSEVRVVISFTISA